MGCKASVGILTRSVFGRWGRTRSATFGGCRYRLPGVFRAWVFKAIDEKFVAELLDCEKQCEFDALLRRLATSLSREWARAMVVPMKLGPAIKSPSLVLKHLCGCDEFSEAIVEVRDAISSRAAGQLHARGDASCS